MKYVLMGTSSNFGNMFSNNLLYDLSEMTIPADNFDEEQLRRPSRWDTAQIRRFMLFFGPISSLFDFAMFAILLLGLHAGPILFRSGWFVGSQSLAIFVIRTRRVLFFRSRPGAALLVSTLVVVAVGVWLPFSPLAGPLGFTRLPARFLVAIAVLIPAYLLLLLELGKQLFYRREAARPSPPAQAASCTPRTAGSFAGRPAGAPTARCTRLARHRRDRSRAPSPASS